MTGAGRPPGWALGDEEAAADMLRDLAHAVHPRDFALVAKDPEDGAVRYLGTLLPDALRDMLEAIEAEAGTVLLFEDDADPAPGGRPQ